MRMRDDIQASETETKASVMRYSDGEPFAVAHIQTVCGWCGNAIGSSGKCEHGCDDNRVDRYDVCSHGVVRVRCRECE